MKRVIAMLVCLAVLPVFADAHPGRTDASGGHIDRSTGDYHYHHGYEAHYHTGGVCPFAFDDKTGQNSGTPSGSPGSAVDPPDVEWVLIAEGWWHNPDLDQWKDAEGNIYTGTEYYEALGYTWHEDIGIWTGEDGIINEDGIFQSYEDLAAEIEASAGVHEVETEEEPPEASPQKEDAEHPVLEAVGVIFLIGFFVVYPTGAVVLFVIEQFRDWRTKRHRFKEEQSNYQALYGGKTREEIAKLCGMPDSCWIGKDGLPEGEGLTFYVSPSGKTFHRTPVCTKNAVIPCSAAKIWNRTPCKRCHPEQPDLSWYYKYKTAMVKVETYKVSIK